LCSCLFAPQFFLPSLAFVHRQSLQLIHDPRAHLHQPVPVAKQLSQITILWTRYPDSWKTIFQQQLQQESDILAVGLLLAYSLGLDLCGIADPQKAAKFYRELAVRVGSVRVGIEANGYPRWFERLLAELGIGV
jgi:hypothetical protein